MAVVPAHSNCWEQVTAAEVVSNPALSAIRDPKRSVLWFEHDKTDTYLFRTQEGTLGILRIAGLSDDRRTVLIRYRLVSREPHTTPVALPSQTDTTLTPTP